MPSTSAPAPERLRGDAGLSLELAATLDLEIIALIRREFAAICATLQPWGRFLAPVELCSAPDLDTLRARAGGPTDGVLQAAATATTVVVLAPANWPSPPSGLELRRVLTHELAHALLFQRCAPPGRSAPVALPCWFREGMALVASEGRPDVRRRLRAAQRADLLALADADAAAIAQAPAATYDVAATLFDAWYERFGTRRLRELCRAMRDGHRFGDAFARACGLAESGWLEATAAALSAHAHDGRPAG